MASGDKDSGGPPDWWGLSSSGETKDADLKAEIEAMRAKVKADRAAVAGVSIEFDDAKVTDPTGGANAELTAQTTMPPMVMEDSTDPTKEPADVTHLSLPPVTPPPVVEPTKPIVAPPVRDAFDTVEGDNPLWAAEDPALRPDGAPPPAAAPAMAPPPAMAPMMVAAQGAPPFVPDDYSDTTTKEEPAGFGAPPPVDDAELPPVRLNRDDYEAYNKAQPPATTTTPGKTEPTTILSDGVIRIGIIVAVVMIVILVMVTVVFMIVQIFDPEPEAMLRQMHVGGLALVLWERRTGPTPNGGCISAERLACWARRPVDEARAGIFGGHL